MTGPNLDRCTASVMYGCTGYGGTSSSGTVFSITTAGALNVLHLSRGQAHDDNVTGEMKCTRKNTTTQLFMYFKMVWCDLRGMVNAPLAVTVPRPGHACCHILSNNSSYKDFAVALNYLQLYKEIIVDVHVHCLH